MYLLEVGGKTCWTCTMDAQRRPLTERQREDRLFVAALSEARRRRWLAEAFRQMKVKPHAES